ncbi:hypothetical protein L5515_000599 [Caenorhabditis briggsae]|uniref:Uncharacterized protein n=1 Tax=Caenorhabditis briggsae TaxID=6238 RepID=A0AAE9E2A2_CAEBR|nr:hypothetical protein L5515_000599 [Caenorhabditis briggsae]
MAITVQPTSIYFQVDISCQIFTNWCVSLKVIELDTFFPNTAVVTVGPKCLDHRDTIALNTNGEIAGDGWFGNRFEFMGEVTHICTRKGETLMFHRRLGYYPDHLKAIRRKFRVEVNEKGVNQ